MFLITVKAATMDALRDKLIEAAVGMGAEFDQGCISGADQDDTADDSYDGEEYEHGTGTPAPFALSIEPASAPPAMPTFTPALPPTMPTFAPPAATPPAKRKTIVAIAASNPANEHDADGQPWDERIHASSKAKTKDGYWRTKRGADPAMISAIKAANGSKTEAAPAAATPSPFELTVMPKQQGYVVHYGAPGALPPPVPGMPAFAPPPVQAPTPAPVAPPPAPVAPPVAAPAAYENLPMPPVTAHKPAHTLATFKENIIPTFVHLVKTQQITQYYIEELKDYFQVTEVWDVKDDPKKLAEVFENFVASGLITKVG